MVSPLVRVTSFGSTKNFYCCRLLCEIFSHPLLLEVLRISTVVDFCCALLIIGTFGSTKNFYCCRFAVNGFNLCAFGSTKNFYCCRYFSILNGMSLLEVLRISTVVDTECHTHAPLLLEVLRISTVVDPLLRW